MPIFRVRIDSFRNCSIPLIFWSNFYLITCFYESESHFCDVCYTEIGKKNSRQLPGCPITLLCVCGFISVNTSGVDGQIIGDEGRRSSFPPFFTTASTLPTRCWRENSRGVRRSISPWLTTAWKMLRTRLTIESNSLGQQNLIGYLIANLKPKLWEERASQIHIPSRKLHFESHLCS